MINTFHAGERVFFNDYHTFAILTRGDIEIFAVADLRKYFLLEVTT